MGEQYGDLVELGFEGVDRFATHFHDDVAAFVGHHHHAHSPQWLGGRSREQKRDYKHGEKRPKTRTRELSPGALGSDTDLPPRAPEPPKSYPDDPLPPPEEHFNRSSGGRYPQQRPARRELAQQPYIPLQQPRVEEFLPKAPPPPIGSQSWNQPHPLPYPPTEPRRQARHRSQFEQDERYIRVDPEPSLTRGDREVRDNYNMPRTHSKKGRREDDDIYGSDVEEDDYYEYTPDGRRVHVREVSRRGRRDDDLRGDDGDEAHIRSVEEKAYYGPGADRGALVVRQEGPEYGYTEKAWGVRGRGRPPPYRRPSSWSPPRHRSAGRDWDEDPRRPRSRSPHHHRTVATILGALAGGVAGSKVKKDDPLPNTVAAVAGAVMGGLGAREAEKVYDRHRERRREEEWEEEQREERRARRRWEREQGY